MLNLHTPRDNCRLLCIFIDPHGPYTLVNEPSNKYPTDHKPGTLRRYQRRYDILDCI